MGGLNGKNMKIENFDKLSSGRKRKVHKGRGFPAINSYFSVAKISFIANIVLVGPIKACHAGPCRQST